MMVQEWQFGNFYGVSNEKGAVGRNIVHPQKNEIPKRLNIISFQDNRSVFEDQYDKLIKTIAQLEKKIIKLEKERSKAKRVHDKLKKIHLFQVLVWGGFGLYLGLVSSAGKLLEVHGPTVTILGTIAASLLYMFCGIGFALLCGWLGKETNEQIVRYYGVTARQCQDEIDLIQLDIEELKKTASRLADKAWG